jgi:hypothetical protein
LSTSIAGTLPQGYIPCPNGLWWIVLAIAALRFSVSQHGRQLSLISGDLQIALCSGQCATWQHLSQYFQPVNPWSLRVLGFKLTETSLHLLHEYLLFLLQPRFAQENRLIAVIISWMGLLLMDA